VTHIVRCIPIYISIYIYVNIDIDIYICKCVETYIWTYLYDRYCGEGGSRVVAVYQGTPSACLYYLPGSTRYLSIYL